MTAADLYRIGIQSSTPSSSMSIPRGVGAPPPPGMDPKRGKLMCIKVRMLDDSVAVFHLGHKAHGQTLLDEVCRHLNLLENDYFGLEFVDGAGNHCWLDKDKPILRQISSSNSDAKFFFVVKFYTPNPVDLEEEYTRYLMTLQIRRDLALGHLLCNESTAALLCAYLVQSDCGDFSAYDYPDCSYLSHSRFVPGQNREFEQRIMDYHKNMVGMSPGESDLALLEVARRCDFYGIKLHNARDVEGTAAALAVMHLGIKVFHQLSCVSTFSWAKIRKLSFKRRKLLIKLHPDSYQYYKETIEFVFDRRDECKTFWKKCVEHHAFFRCTQVEEKTGNGLFSKGSSFRYHGRTQKQLIDYVREHHKRREPFTRPLRSAFNEPSCRAGYARVERPRRAHSSLPHVSHRDDTDDGSIRRSYKREAIYGVNSTFSSENIDRERSDRQKSIDRHGLSVSLTSQVDRFPSSFCGASSDEGGHSIYADGGRKSGYHSEAEESTFKVGRPPLTHTPSNKSGQSQPSPPPRSPTLISSTVSAPVIHDELYRSIEKRPQDYFVKPLAEKPLEVMREMSSFRPPDYSTLKAIDSPRTVDSQKSPNSDINQVDDAMPDPPRLIHTVEPLFRSILMDGTGDLDLHDTSSEESEPYLDQEGSIDTNLVSSSRRDACVRELAMSERSAEADMQLLFQILSSSLPSSIQCALLSELVSTLRQLQAGHAPMWEALQRTVNTRSIPDELCQSMLCAVHNTLPVYRQLVERYPVYLAAIDQLMERNDEFRKGIRNLELSQRLYIPLLWLLLRVLARMSAWQDCLAGLIEFHLSESDSSCDSELSAARVALDRITKFMTDTRSQREAMVEFVAVSEVECDLGCKGKLTTPARRLLRVGWAERWSRGSLVPRFFVLLEDSLLIARKRAAGFRCHTHMSLKGTMVEQGDAFCVSERPSEECVTLHAGKNASILFAAPHTIDWVDSISEAIKKSARSRTAYPLLPNNTEKETDDGNDEEPRECALSAPLLAWHRKTSIGIADFHMSLSHTRSGYLLRQMRSSTGWQRLWVRLARFTLLFYASHEDASYVASLPLLGYEVTLPLPSDGISEPHTFRLSFGKHSYFFRAANRFEISSWIPAIRSNTLNKSPLDALTVLSLNI